jgi:broad specificity phosphatase PhoE
VANYSNVMTSRGELWLIRHGETEWTLSGAHTSRTDLPLTARGEHRVEELKRLLAGRRFDLVLSSPMRRALDTARLAGYAPETTPDLQEWDYGDYEGRTTPDIQKDAPGWTIWTGAPPGGETIAQVSLRVDRLIARAVSVEGDVAMFGHGHTLRVLGARWLGLEPEAGRLLALSTGSISVLGYERDTHVIRTWNQTEA